MPRIEDEFLATAIYLYHNRDDAEQNSYLGGSGFIVGYVDMHTTGVHVYVSDERTRYSGWIHSY